MRSKWPAAMHRCEKSVEKPVGFVRKGDNWQRSRREATMVANSDLTDALNVAEHLGASDLLRRFVSDADMDALIEIGVLLKQNLKLHEAAIVYFHAASTGRVDAMYNLGNTLAMLGNEKEAEVCYQRSASAGHLGAMNALGNLYRKRAARQVKRRDRMRDMKNAKHWLKQAAAGGDWQATMNLRAMGG
jgi:TPR repeat protein